MAVTKQVVVVVVQTEHQGPMGPMVISSPVGTPVEERRVSSGSAGAPAVGVTSRRSSLSPSDRTNRRRDSPACIQLEIPPWHRAILNFIEVTIIQVFHAKYIFLY